jgi:hypothetical protein
MSKISQLFTKKKIQLPVVVLAGCPPSIHERFTPTDAKLIEISTVRGALLALENNPSLVVLDIDKLEEVGEFNREILRQALKTAEINGTPIYSVRDFSTLTDAGVITNLLGTSALTGVRFVIPKRVMFANYSGGVGKSTLALAAARSFHDITGLSAAVIESGIGSSVLLSKVNILEGPSLFDTMRLGAVPRTWNGVDLYPLSEREAFAMVDYGDFMVKLNQLAAVHPLVIIDGSPNSPIWDQLTQFVDEVLVVAAPRNDTIIQATTVYDEIREFWTTRKMPDKRVRLIANMTKNIVEKAAFTEKAERFIDYDEGEAHEYGYAIGDPIVDLLYPGLSIGQHTNFMTRTFGHSNR